MVVLVYNLVALALVWITVPCSRQAGGCPRLRPLALKVSLMPKCASGTSMAQMGPAPLPPGCQPEAVGPSPLAQGTWWCLDMNFDVIPHAGTTNLSNIQGGSPSCPAHALLQITPPILHDAPRQKLDSSPSTGHSSGHFSLLFLFLACRHNSLNISVYNYLSTHLNIYW